MPSVLRGRIIKKNTKDLDSTTGMHFLQAAVSDLRSKASLQSNAHALCLDREEKNRILSMWLLWATFLFPYSGRTLDSSYSKQVTHQFTMVTLDSICYS